jgi:hypothetical protein
MQMHRDPDFSPSQQAAVLGSQALRASSMRRLAGRSPCRSRRPGVMLPPYSWRHPLTRIIVGWTYQETTTPAHRGAVSSGSRGTRPRLYGDYIALFQEVGKPSVLTAAIRLVADWPSAPAKPDRRNGGRRGRQHGWNEKPQTTEAVCAMSVSPDRPCQRDGRVRRQQAAIRLFIPRRIRGNRVLPDYWPE